MDGFTTLALGNGIAQILVPILALLGMTLLLFTAAALFIRRRDFAAA